MWDVAGAGVNGVALQSPYAPGLLFIAGALSSIGPCCAPRMMAMSGLVMSTGRKRIARSLAFIAGMLTAYGAFAVVGGLMAATLRFSSWIYDAVALAMLVGGLSTLLRCKRHAHDSAVKETDPSGSAFLLGFTTSLVISPCCTPVLTGIVAYASGTNNAPFAAACIVAFGTGHALPIFTIGAAATSVHRIAANVKVESALSTVTGALMFAIAAYYLVLA